MQELDADRVSQLRPHPCTPLTEAEIVAAVRTGLAKPCGYPALAQATVPGDRVVVAVGPGVPCLEQIIVGAFAALRQAGVKDSLVSVLLPEQFGELAMVRSQLEEVGAGDCPVLRHDPSDGDAIGMLGVAPSGEAVRLNRLLGEADVVLSIGAVDVPASFNGLYPEYSDRATIHRLAAPLVAEDQAAHKQRAQEIAHSGELLGLGLVVRVVPAPEGRIARVVVGEARQVFAACDQLQREVWSVGCPTPADLVIAALVGDAAEQTWQKLGQAVQAAIEVVSETGSIVVCSELEQLPGPVFQHLAANEDYEVAARQILQDGLLADSWAAWQLCRALQHGPVYLCSKLPDRVVESVGFTPLAVEHELERLMQVHDHVLVVPEAQRLQPHLAI